MKNQKINLIAVGSAVIISMLIPAIWYYLFAESWLSGNGLTEQILQDANGPVPYIVALLANIVSVYALAWLFLKLKVDSWQSGVLHALVVGLAFYFVHLASQNVFSLRTIVLTLIDGGVVLLAFIASGALLGGWRKYEE